MTLPGAAAGRRDGGSTAAAQKAVYRKDGMAEMTSRDPLHGITLERMVTDLQARLGWEGLAERVHIRCFRENPSISSSLRFLRRTPWARAKIERLYLKMIGGKRPGSKKPRGTNGTK
jgi:uncharacterized protein (DUF2132 family)